MNRPTPNRYFTGVRRVVGKKAWFVRVFLPNGKRVRVEGEFESEVEAALAYDRAALELIGHAAPTNFLKGVQVNPCSGGRLAGKAGSGSCVGKGQQQSQTPTLQAARQRSRPNARQPQPPPLRHVVSTNSNGRKLAKRLVAASYLKRSNKTTISRLKRGAAPTAEQLRSRNKLLRPSARGKLGSTAKVPGAVRSIKQKSEKGPSPRKGYYGGKRAYGTSSKYRGVTHFKPTSTWQAQIVNEGKILYLGRHATELEKYVEEMKEWVQRTNNNLDAIPADVLRRITTSKRPAEDAAAEAGKIKRSKGSGSMNDAGVIAEVDEQKESGEPMIGGLESSGERAAVGKQRKHLILEIKKEDSSPLRDGGSVGAHADNTEAVQSQGESVHIKTHDAVAEQAQVKSKPSQVFLRPPQRPLKTSATFSVSVAKAEKASSTPPRDVSKAAEEAGDGVAHRTRQKTGTPDAISSRTRCKGPASPISASADILPAANPKPTAASAAIRTKRLSRHSPSKESAPQHLQSSTTSICQTMASPRRLFKSIHRMVVSAVTEGKGSQSHT